MKSTLEKDISFVLREKMDMVFNTENIDKLLKKLKEIKQNFL